MITYTKQKNNHLYLLQTDQEKAFDKVDRNLYKTSEKIRISPLFINFLKILYTQKTSMIINNGFLSPQVSLQRGLGQGYPLSLPLYVIQGQVITTNINQNNNITGIYIPNQKNQVKISPYADDSNFFLKNQESVNNVLKVFYNQNKATGTTMNLEKTTVLPINTENTEQLQKITPKITNKKQFETIKILGIYYINHTKTSIIHTTNIIWSPFRESKTQANNNAIS